MSFVRDITIKAKRYLENDDILLFIGARQAGKTTILRQLNSILEKNGQATYFINLEDPEYLDLLNKSPKNLLKIFTLNLQKKNFVFIDEVQYLKNPSNFLKYFYDEYKGKIKILASGSSAFYLDKKFKDSLAGRKKIFYVSTLSFKEFLLFKNEESLSRLNLGNLGLAEAEKIILCYREYMIYGGYPRVVLSSLEEKIDNLHEIAYSYIKKDIFEANIRQDDIFYKLFKILSFQIGSLVNASELANTLGVSKTSIENYLYVMHKSFHLHFLKPFHRNIRKELTKMPKVYFSDLGLRNFFANDFRNLEDRQDYGSLLENAVFLQLSKKYEEDSLRFWRTIQRNEVDFVLNEKEAFEVKANVKNFKEKNYKVFLDTYPDIKLSVVSFDTKDKIVGNHKIMEVWEI